MRTRTNADRPSLGEVSARAEWRRTSTLPRWLAELRGQWAKWLDRGVLLTLTGAGLASADGLAAWYSALAIGFLGIASAVLLGAGVVTLFSERSEARLQGRRSKPAPIWREMRDTALAAWVASCLLAWPLSRMWSGRPTGLVWTLEEAGGALRIFGSTLLALVVLDAWLYWKHRLLHTRWFFPFHRAHHAFRDPTAFAGFAVGPVESLLTFWPLVLIAIPETPHYAPVYFALVIGFITLNFYLHCGVSVPALEATLPRGLLNTSSFHNRHHANAAVNFSEAFTLWDYVCHTRERAGKALIDETPR
jgi:lathosterol oxidase